MASIKDLLLLLTILTFYKHVLSLALKDTCGSKDTAIKISANIPTDVEVLGAYEKACYSVASLGGNMVIALLTDAPSPQMYLLSPKDAQAAPYPSYNFHSVTGDQVREVLIVKGDATQAGDWQVSVVNIDRESIVYSLVVYVSDPEAIMAHPRDLLAYQSLFDRCCASQGSCFTWRDLGGRAANPCGLPGFLCDLEGFITSFQMLGTPAGIHLVCAFPHEIFQRMDKLKTLSLRWHPELTGQVNWTALATLPDLEVLDLSFTALKGPIGCNLASGKLKSLDLSSIPSFTQSKFTGDLPHCYMTKPEMEVLRLSYNELTGPLPPAGNWTENSALEWLALDNNQLSGELPGPYDANNKWVYNGLGRLPHLRILQLSNNQLWGHVPESLNQPSLLQIDISRNALTYIVSDHILGRSTLRSLRLNNNKLSGAIPDALTQMSNLTEITLHDNMLSGPIPKDWSKMQELVWLTLNNNAFSGPLPQSIMGIKQLLVLDVSNNLLTGPIPSIPSVTGTFQVPRTLAMLDLDNNQFTGNIPENFELLPAFQTQRIQTVVGTTLVYEYSFRNNSLSGPLPTYVYSLGQDSALSLDGNDQLECPMKYVSFAGLECTAPNPKEPAPKKAMSKVGLAFLVIGILGGLAIIAAAVVFLLYKRKQKRPAQLGELETMPKDGSKNSMGHKLYRLLTQRKEPSYVKFAGDSESWGLARSVG